MNREGLVSRKELAELLGVTLRTVDKLVRDGMPSVRVRRRRMFLYSDVLAWARAHPEWARAHPKVEVEVSS